jgi:hypothetical protein
MSGASLPRNPQSVGEILTPKSLPFEDYQTIRKYFRRKSMTIPTEQATIHADVYTDEINKFYGHTIDQDGLTNSYAIEPEMYGEDSSFPAELGNRITVVDVFASKLEAKNAVLEIEQKGLRSQQISIIAKGYQDTKSCMTWESIEASGGLALILTEMGISERAIEQFVNAVENGKYLIIVTGNDREASQAEYVLQTFGHRIIIVD